MPRRATIYRNAELRGADCSNSGISRRYTRVTIINLPGRDEPTASAPAVELITRWAGTPGEYVHAEPVDAPAGVIGPMAGGCIIVPDNVPGEVRQPRAYPLHDRYETPAEYERMSR